MNDYYPPGVDNLPDDELLVDYDFRGNELYKGDMVYDTPFGFLLVDDVEEYMVSEFGKPIEME